MKKIIIGLFPLFFFLFSLGSVKVLYDMTLTNQKQLQLTPSLQQKINQNQKRQQKKQKENIGNVDLHDLAKAKVNYVQTIEKQAIGQLYVPSIHLSLPILKEATDETLTTGAAQYFPERKMGEGNYVLASHNFFGAPVLMAHIRLLKKGDLLFVQDFMQEWCYQVVENSVVKETAIEKVAETKQPQLTLIRCEGGANTPYRRIVRAILKKKTKKRTQTITFSDNESKKSVVYHNLIETLSTKNQFNFLKLKIGEIFQTKQTLRPYLIIWGISLMVVTGSSLFYLLKKK